MMRNPKVVVGLVLLAMAPVLVGGCILKPEKGAVLWLDITPEVVYLDQRVNLRFTLREVEGVGVTLNHWKEEIYDQEDKLIDVIDVKDEAAHLMFNSLFGTYDIHGNETLSGTIPFTPSLPRGRRRWIFGGVDRLYNTVHGVGEVLIE